MHWNPTSNRVPSEGQVVECISPGGEVRQLKHARGLWWLPDGSMYVYFTPTFWREI